MKYVILSDNTKIGNCTDSTTSQNIVALRNSYEEAGAVRDMINNDNSEVISVYNEDDTEVVTGSDLVLLAGCTIKEVADGYTCIISLRNKTTEEKMKEQIEELQETILG